MFREFFAIFVIISLATQEVQSNRGVKSGLKGCFKQKCPESTFACRRFQKISDDKAEIISDIQCLGLQNKVLQNITTTEPNHFGPNVFFQGFSYTAALEFHDDNFGTNINHNKDVENKITDVDKDVSMEKSDKSTPQSEADDLNNVA